MSDATARAQPDRTQGVITTSIWSTVADAAAMMSERNIGCILVVDGEGRLAGILSERDVLNRVVAKGMDPNSTRVAQVMTSDLACCRPGTGMDDARAIMAERKIRHLPVVDAERAVGMISSRDVLDHQLAATRAAKTAAEEVAKLAKAFKSLELDDLIDVVVREVPALFGADHAMLWLGSEGDSEPCMARNHCVCTPGAPREWAEPAGDQQRVRIEPAPESCRSSCEEIGERMAIPLQVATLIQDAGGQRRSLAGCLCLCGGERCFSGARELTRYRAALVREVVASVLSNARAHHDARACYMTDPLTGASTRRVFVERLGEECQRTTRYNRPFCLAIMDVDRFKTMNDELGHAVGDEVLARVARTVQSEKRASDVLARYGGDEFVLLMPETDLDSGVPVLDRIRARVEELPMPSGFAVTLSCGVCQHESGLLQPAEELFRRADMALYDAKKGGRNCTRSWRHLSGKLGYDEFVQAESVKVLQSRIAEMSARSTDTFAQSLWGLVRAIEARDPFTRHHSRNVTRLSVGLARAMGIEAGLIDTIRRAAMIHDIGMIGVPDSILTKPGELDETERQVIEQHPRIGVHIIQGMRFLEREVPMVRHHHERFDGTGYPGSLAGQRIPQGARIIALADALDAMTSNRSHRESRPLGEALVEIMAAAGSQFDPEAVEVLMNWVQSVAAGRGQDNLMHIEDLLGSQ